MQISSFFVPAMTNHPAPPSDPTQAGDDRAWARPLFEQQIALLSELAEAGMAAVHAIQDQVAARDGDVVALARAFERVARGVRLAILLQSKLIKQLQDWDRQTAWLTANGPGAGPGDGQDQRETEIDRAAAERDLEHAEHIERLVGEASGRLERDDIYNLVDTRPVSELIAMIRQDIGLDADWPLQMRDAGLQKDVISAAAGSPFASPADREIGQAGSSPHGRPLGRPPDSH
jgi:hypothetical protein